MSNNTVIDSDNNKRLIFSKYSALVQTDRRVSICTPSPQI